MPLLRETVLAVARRCKHCKEEIAEGGGTESIRKRLAAKEEKLAKGQPAIPGSVGKKIRTVTIVGAVIAAVALLASAVAVAAGGEEMAGLAVIGLTVAFIAGICALMGFANDMGTPSGSQRTTPEKGLKAFLRSMCFKRYNYAYACLLDGDKDDLGRVRPKLEKFGKKGPDCSFATYNGFRDYWSGLLRHKSSQPSVGRISLVDSKGEFATVSAQVKLTRSSTTGSLLLGIIGALLMGDKEKVTVTKLLRKVDGQWYVVNGELESAEDGALDVAAELAGK